MKPKKKKQKNVEPKVLKPRELKPTLGLEFIDSVCELVADGEWYSYAAQGLGVPRSTATWWMREGRKDITNGDTETLHAILYRAVRIAESQGSTYHVRNVKRAGAYDWKASAWFMAKRYKKWRDDDSKIEGGGAHLQKSELDTSKLTPEECATLAALHDKARVE